MGRSASIALGGNRLRNPDRLPGPLAGLRVLDLFRVPASPGLTAVPSFFLHSGIR
ncbi:hypothetical protein [Roseomonas chloroacetimidivorans]|jgi:hypothetical protein|uniref:hypothetical protein n=1 Tax=Roseomonas chloroacetimidivorans TaxID=1766656 RepID=UPI003C739D58